MALSRTSRPRGYNRNTAFTSLKRITRRNLDTRSAARRLIDRFPRGEYIAIGDRANFGYVGGAPEILSDREFTNRYGISISQFYNDIKSFRNTDDQITGGRVNFLARFEEIRDRITAYALTHGLSQANINALYDLNKPGSTGFALEYPRRIYRLNREQAILLSDPIITRFGRIDRDGDIVETINPGFHSATAVDRVVRTFLNEEYVSRYDRGAGKFRKPVGKRVSVLESTERRLKFIESNKRYLGLDISPPDLSGYEGTLIPIPDPPVPTPERVLSKISLDLKHIEFIQRYLSKYKGGLISQLTRDEYRSSTEGVVTYNPNRQLQGNSPGVTKNPFEFQQTLEYNYPELAGIPARRSSSGRGGVVRTNLREGRNAGNLFTRINPYERNDILLGILAKRAKRISRSSNLLSISF